MQNLKKRLKSVAFMLLVTIPIVLVTYFLNNQYGKIIGAVSYLILSLYAVYETIQHNKQNLITNFTITSLTLVIWFLPQSIYQTDEFISSTKRYVISEIIEISRTALLYNQDVLFSLLIPILIISVFVFLLMISDFRKYETKNKFLLNYLITIFSTIFIPFFFKLLYIFNATFIYGFLTFLLIPMSVDTTGYFGGMLLGRKIIKRNFCKISPKKTWEGAIVSYIFGALLSLFLLYSGQMFNVSKILFFTNWKQILIAVLLLPIISIIGDLFFSWIKRKYEIKDFSNLMPGHGGVMDRFDSISFVSVSIFMILFIK
ncbi:hypothetical protein MHSN_00615 [Metamycoplasma hyosynoviae]|uniref:Phosphatidate cytidylyltransferase n=1 Tax=Metamycoplasma hyosynoviae TaxID=29559 RepID=A0A4P1QFW0_9BACT|nr:phosphatidate cytidylyltransferase [Metamycoplasma hyosynoviae]ASI53723.1 hypothetical protein MHSN_00615 [Metamycoplasma hyosynoviae]